jgi:hypothetical protein
VTFCCPWRPKQSRIGNGSYYVMARVSRDSHQYAAGRSERFTGEGSVGGDGGLVVGPIIC